MGEKKQRINLQSILNKNIITIIIRKDRLVFSLNNKIFSRNFLLGHEMFNDTAFFFLDT
jgi:hypothetical protein